MLGQVMTEAIDHQIRPADSWRPNVCNRLALRAARLPMAAEASPGRMRIHQQQASKASTGKRNPSTQAQAELAAPVNKAP